MAALVEQNGLELLFQVGRCTHKLVLRVAAEHARSVPLGCLLCGARPDETNDEKIVSV